MNTGNLRGISLSSLAVSVSTGGLLGVTGVALGDDPYEPVCHVGESCEVSYYGEAPGNPQWNPGWVTHYGFCGFSDGGMQNCGCEGVMYYYVPEAGEGPPGQPTMGYTGFANVWYAGNYLNEFVDQCRY